MAYNHGSEMITKAMSNGMSVIEIDTYQYVGWVTVWATLLPTATAPVTLSFEAAAGSLADESVPDAADWTPVEQEFPCDDGPNLVTLTLDPADPYFSATEGLHAWVRIDRCKRFLRLTGVPANTVVVATGELRRGYPT